ncbi:MAG TPA: DinB family protein [Dehalococcoidia bacterium]|nr:DinB family protein [Dehalococcoidia bacterium]
MTARGSADIPSLLRALAAAPDHLEAAVRDVGDDALNAAPEGEWSARTVLAHLRDDEFMVMRLRLVRVTVEDHPTLTPFDQEAWATSRWRGRDAPGELLADFRLQREASLMVLRRLEGDDWLRTGLQPEYGTFDAHWWLEHWVEHDGTHIAQVQAALAAAGRR